MERGKMQGQIHQVGPKYGVRDYLRTIESAYDNTGPMGGKIALDGLARKLRPHDIADAMEAEYAESCLAGSVLSTARREGRRLGKPMVEQWIEVAFTAIIRAMDGDRRADPAVGTVRTTARIEAGRIMNDFVRLNAYVSVHALERLYERASIPMGGMPAALSATMTGMHHGMAVAFRAGIHVSPEAKSAELMMEGMIPSTTLVPFGEGLLVVESMPMLIFGQPVHRHEIRRGRILERPAPSASCPATPLPKDWEHGFAQAMFVGRTYLSREILRPEQIDYLETFSEILKQDDARESISAFFHFRERHARPSIGISLDEAKIDHLKALLPRCVSLGPNLHRLFAITRRAPGESLAQPITYDRLKDHLDNIQG